MNSRTCVDRRRPTRLITPKASPSRTMPGRAQCSPTERLALFACAFARDSALEVLEGLVEPERTLARTYARQVAAWDSPLRQAKVSLEFGTQPQAEQQLRSMIAEASPALRRELYRRLPPHHRSLFPELAQVIQTELAVVPAGMVAFAKRMVREATR
jgi:hypothetical protein